ncbi:MAG: hypothetical protein U9Q06_04715 [Nanoarchaeota archaeon]|nr:hypothetical protein [Nanoarchaeota archaeon]
MAKKIVKKSSKVAKRKTVKKPVKKIAKKTQRKSRGYVFNFFRVFLLVLVIFGIYRAWILDWVQGVSIIGLAIIIWLIAELIKTLRK